MAAKVTNPATDTETTSIPPEITNLINIHIRQSIIDPMSMRPDGCCSSPLPTKDQLSNCPSRFSRLVTIAEPMTIRTPLY